MCVFFFCNRSSKIASTKVEFNNFLIFNQTRSFHLRCVIIRLRTSILSIGIFSVFEFKVYQTMYLEVTHPPSNAPPHRQGTPSSLSQWSPRDLHPLAACLQSLLSLVWRRPKGTGLRPCVGSCGPSCTCRLHSVSRREGAEEEDDEILDDVQNKLRNLSISKKKKKYSITKKIVWIFESQKFIPKFPFNSGNSKVATNLYLCWSYCSFLYLFK